MSFGSRQSQTIERLQSQTIEALYDIYISVY